MWKVIDKLSFEAKNVYNCANYIIRQEFIKNKRWIGYYELDKMMQGYECYYDLGSQAAQNTLKVLDKNWKSFFKAIKDWSKNPHKYLGRPRIPRYKDKENGRSILMLKNIQCRIKDGQLIFSWKPFREFKINTNVQGKVMQVRFVPKGDIYAMEIVYEIDIPEPIIQTNRIIGIDLGIDNFATVSNNVNENPFIINGKILKSMNQYYNKNKAKLQSNLKIRHDKNWSKKLQSFTNKRNNKIKDSMHKASKYIVDWCIEHQIDTVVIGKNNNWKQESNMGTRTNQNFISIPFEIFIDQIEYKCGNVGINFVKTEESYTSGTSFLDNELPRKENYDKSRRIKRGLFKSNNGTVINADLNGSYQIIKKVFPNAFVNGIEDAGSHPIRVNLI